MARARIAMPLIEFLFTLDQLAMMLNVTEERLARDYLFFEGVSTGIARGRMRARDISTDATRRDWRVSSSQWKLFLSRRGWQVVEPQLHG